MNARERSFAKHVAHLMKSTRLEKSLTQKEVAGKLGVAQGTLSKMENGRLIPSVVQWFDFCRYTGLSSDSIMKHEPSQPVEHMPTQNP